MVLRVAGVKRPTFDSMMSAGSIAVTVEKTRFPFLSFLSFLLF